MIVTTNYVEQDRRLNLARIQTYVGVALLLASVATFFVPLLLPNLVSAALQSQLTIILGYPLLIIGLLFFKRGQFIRRRYKGLGRIRPELEQIEKELADLPPRYNLFNYVDLGGLMVDHLLVTPKGLMIITAKPHTGAISASHDKWRRKLGLFGFLTVFGEPGLGDPSREIANLVKRSRDWFTAREYDLPSDGLIVFTAPERDVNPGGLGVKLGPFEGMSFPVIPTNELRAAVRGWDTDTRMANDEQGALERLIGEQMPEQRDHPDFVRDVRGASAANPVAASHTKLKDGKTTPVVSRAALRQARKEEEIRRARYGADPVTGKPLEKQIPYRKPLPDGTLVAPTAKGTRPNPQTANGKPRNTTKAPSAATTATLPDAPATSASTTVNPSSLQGNKNGERRRKQ